ncbi:MAG: zinc-ribbon domain-containing protein [Ruminococcaceae bacterium]|nr:zinc-ribbon domain-containing protein [Oscillospiraceae bacterium]
MITLGVISLIAGIFLYMTGNSMNNDVKAQLESFFNDGVTNPGSDYETFGVILIVLGIIFIIIGTVNKRKDGEVTPPPKYENQQPHISNNTANHKWRCNGCGNMISTDFCPHCGKGQSAQEHSAAKRTCPHCGKDVSAESKFCMHCGKEM